MKRRISSHPVLLALLAFALLTSMGLPVSAGPQGDIGLSGEAGVSSAVTVRHDQAERAALLGTLELTGANVPMPHFSFSSMLGQVTPTATPVPTGVLKICKVAGPGVGTGELFRFNIEATGFTTMTVDVPAGSCVLDGTFPAGTVVTITEQQTGSTTVTAITPTAGADLAAGRTTITIQAGQEATVTFTNAKRQARLQICKEQGGLLFGNFTFTIGPAGATSTANATQTITLPPGATTDVCTAPFDVLAGGVTVTESSTTPFVLNNVTTRAIGGVQCTATANVATSSASVGLGSGDSTGVCIVIFSNRPVGTTITPTVTGTVSPTVTATLSPTPQTAPATNTPTRTATPLPVETGSLKICKVAGPGVQGGELFRLAPRLQVSPPPPWMCQRVAVRSTARSRPVRWSRSPSRPRAARWSQPSPRRRAPTSTLDSRLSRSRAVARAW